MELSRFKEIIFKEPQPQWIYQRLRRSTDPIKEVLNLERELKIEIVDRKELNRIRKEIKRLLIIGVFIGYYLKAFHIL